MIMFFLRVMGAYSAFTFRYRAPQTAVPALGLAAAAYLLLGGLVEPLRSCWAVLLLIKLILGYM